MHNNKEIEVKLILQQQQYEHIWSWAQQNATFIGIQEQIDSYFEHHTAPCRYTNSAGIIEVDPCLLRLRTIIDGPSFLTSKVKTFDPITDRISNINEYETIVADGAIMRMILESVGYQTFATIQKKRIIYQFEIFEVSFDDVQDLGTFVEIELKEQGISNQEGITKIHAFIKHIGLTECRSSTRGYLNMILNPGYDFTVSLFS